MTLFRSKCPTPARWGARQGPRLASFHLLAFPKGHFANCSRPAVQDVHGCSSSGGWYLGPECPECRGVTSTNCPLKTGFWPHQTQSQSHALHSSNAPNQWSRIGPESLSPTHRIGTAGGVGVPTPSFTAGSHPNQSGATWISLVQPALRSSGSVRFGPTGKCFAGRNWHSQTVRFHCLVPCNLDLASWT